MNGKYEIKTDTGFTRGVSQGNYASNLVGEVEKIVLAYEELEIKIEKVTISWEDDQ